MKIDLECRKYYGNEYSNFLRKFSAFYAPRILEYAQTKYRKAVEVLDQKAASHILMIYLLIA